MGEVRQDPGKCCVHRKQVRRKEGSTGSNSAASQLRRALRPHQQAKSCGFEKSSLMPSGRWRQIRIDSVERQRGGIGKSEDKQLFQGAL